VTFKIKCLDVQYKCYNWQDSESIVTIFCSLTKIANGLANCCTCSFFTSSHAWLPHCFSYLLLIFFLWGYLNETSGLFYKVIFQKDYNWINHNFCKASWHEGRTKSSGEIWARLIKMQQTWGYSSTFPNSCAKYSILIGIRRNNNGPFSK